MALSMYQASVPIFIKFLGNLADLLEKGRADAEARKFAPEILMQARLAPDMHPLSRQVQIASDMVKNGAARLADVAAPAFPDTETSFEMLAERVAKTIAFLDTLQEAQFADSDSRNVTLKLPGREIDFTGAEYLTRFVLPNFYFHLTTAFAILRHNGVTIGKMDFMGA